MEKMAAIFGPASLLPKCSQFRLPIAMGLIEFSAQSPRKTLCASDHSAQTQIPNAAPLHGCADQTPQQLRSNPSLHFNTPRYQTEEWGCSNGY
jgi:hypothetical protein